MRVCTLILCTLRDVHTPTYSLLEFDGPVYPVIKRFYGKVNYTPRSLESWVFSPIFSM